MPTADTQPISRLDAAEAARLCQEDWQKVRDTLLSACRQCDSLIREADRLTAETIRVVSALYTDAVLSKPASRAAPFPPPAPQHDQPISGPWPGSPRR